ncbi:hypothetical protein LWM68_31725 [Niabella sp. W65]|nr:hypothetical protein [Niabella sp. W65]MCH7366935.1 hypothetical protein [Niabella sp. W65]ULT42628.1 hypothetical protein KRR40_03265 [Niabella sp. I65]
MGQDWYVTGSITYSSYQNDRSSQGFNNLQFGIGLKKLLPGGSPARAI